MTSDSEGEQARIDISFTMHAVPSSSDFAIVAEGSDASPSSPAHNNQLIEIASSPESMRQHGAEADCERSRSRGQLRDLCRAGTRATAAQHESDALVPLGESDIPAGGALSNTLDSLASSLCSITAAMEDQKKMAELQAAQLIEAKDRENMHIAQLREREFTIKNQQLDIARGNERARELEERLRQAEKASSTAQSQLWQARIEIAKEDLRQEMQTILSPTMCDTEQRLLKATPTSLSLGESCQSQFHTLWKCFVLIYHIPFKTDAAAAHLKQDLTPWRRARNLDKEGMSVEGRKKMEQFDKEMRQFTTGNFGYSDSDWQNMMQIYRRFWPFKGPTPEALDWWSLSIQELLQAVPWNNIFFPFKKVSAKYMKT